MRYVERRPWRGIICWLVGHDWLNPKGKKRGTIAFAGDDCGRCGGWATTRIRSSA